MPLPPNRWMDRPPWAAICGCEKSTGRAIGSHTHEYCGWEFTPYLYVNLNTN